MNTSSSLSGDVGGGRMRSKPKTKAGQAAKVQKVLREFKAGSLRSGSKSGPKVKKRKQAIAIALSEAGKAKRK